MSVNTYTPDSTKIIHNTSVDFITRYINSPVHLVQYDNSTPIIAVKLYSNGTPYVIPAGMDVNVRIRKPDRTVIYNPVLGCNSDRNIVYVEATTQICAVAGDLYPIIEISSNNNISASGYFYLELDANPVQDADIQSTSEAKALEPFIKESKSWAVGGTGTREGEDTNNSKYWSTVSANYEADAQTHANDAANSANQSSSYATNAANSAADSDASATAAATSANSASSSVVDSAANATLAKSWAVGGTGTRVDEDTYNASYYASQASSSATSSSNSATAAATSKSDAENKAKLAESWAVGGTGTRTGEDTDNAKYWANQASAVSGLHIATTTVAGIVKADGTSITVDPDGTLHSSGGGPGTGYMKEADYVNAGGTGEVLKSKSVGNAITGVLEGLSEDANGNLLYKSNPISSDSDDVWGGTKQEYAIDDAAGKIKDGTVVIIDNDEDELPTYVNTNDFDLTNGVLSLDNKVTAKLSSLNYTSSDSGKALKVKDDGSALEWGEVQGGISPSDMLGFDTTQGETVDDGIARVENNTAHNKVVDALVIKDYANVSKSRIIVSVGADATGKGTWIDEGTTWTSALETTNEWIGYDDANVRSLLTVADADKDKVELQFMFEVVDANSCPVYMGGYQWDTSTGMLCIKFGAPVTNATKIAIDVIKTRG